MSRKNSFLQIFKVYHVYEYETDLWGNKKSLVCQIHDIWFSFCSPSPQKRLIWSTFWTAVTRHGERIMLYIYIYFGLFHFLYLVNTPSLIAAPLVYMFSLLPGKKHPKHVFQDRGIFFCLTCINLTFLQVSKAQRSWNLIGLLLDEKYLFSLCCLPHSSIHI